MKTAKIFSKCLAFFLLSVAVFLLTASRTFADVEIKTANFPDSAFKTFVSENFDTNGDGTLSNAELAAVTEINVSNKGITNLNGIKYFTALEVLSCDNNSLTALDLSYNTKLVTLDCSHNSLKELDLSSLTSLSTLNCYYNYLNVLNVSNTALTQLIFSKGFRNSTSYYFNMHSGSSTGIYAKNCSKLETVRFEIQPYMDILDLTGCSSLKEIYIAKLQNNYRSIYELILKNCQALEDLSGTYSSLANMGIEVLDVSGCTSLVSLDCYSDNYGYIQELDVRDSTNLKYLKCSGHLLTMLDLSNNSALTSVDCYEQYNHIASYSSSTLSSIKYTKQKLYLTGNDDYRYQYDFTALIPAEYISRIDGDSIVSYNSNGTVIDDNVKYENGILMLKDFASYVDYEFNTGYNDEVIHARFLCQTSSGGTPKSPTITTSSLSYGIVGLSYSETISATGTTPITWSVTSGTLPGGLSLNSSTGVISGVPTTAGTSTFTVQAKNIGGTVTKEFTLAVGDISGGGGGDSSGGDDSGGSDAASDEDNEDGSSSISKIYSKPKITTETLFEGTVGLEYGYILKAEGTMPIIWGLASGDDFPAGLTLKQVGQITQITGTPTTSGDFTFTVQAQNSVGLVSKDLTIKINPAPEKTKPTILTSELEPAIVGINYGCQLMASGTPPIKWSITKPKKFSPGMKDLEFSSSGSFGGIITRAQKVKITVRAENEYGSFSKIFTLQSYVAPNINLTSFKDAKVWKKYTGTFKTKPTATKPLTWTLAGALPSGFRFDSSKGKITGTGTPENYGAYPLIIKVSNPASEDIKSFTFNVSADLPKITLKSLPKGTDGKAYKAVVKASGTKPVSFDIVSGYSLPDGLSFDSETGKFSGTPTATCTDKKIKIKASNVAGETVKDYYLTIKAVAPKFTTKSLESGMLNTAYSASVDIAGTKPFKVSVSGLPAGLQFNADESVITGTPTESGTFNVTLTASNSVKSMTKKFKLVIYAPPSFNDNATLPAATADKAYKKFKFNMSGTQKIILQFDSGVLPEGMSIAPSTGSLSGKPKAAGTFTFTVKATNVYGSATKEFTLTVNAVPPKISGSLKSGKVGNAYSSKLKVKGTAPMNWVVDGAIPEGLDFVDGVLSGTPTAAFDGYMTITASNASYPGGGKDTKFFRLKITGTTTPTTTTDSKSVSEIETPAGTPASDAEKDSENAQKLFVGNPRKISDVKNLKLLDSYKIAAVLPEISVSESGLYELEVEISEDIEIGEKLIYLALPQNSEPSEDDEIAEFYNLDGEEISTVPENHKIILGAWFNENIIYAPVIAVKKE